MDVIVDTGVWFAMFDDRDERYAEGQDKADLLEVLRLVIPWPTMYEVLRSKFVRNRLALDRFERYLKARAPDITYLNDAEYRAAAFELSFESSLRRNRPLSMVDCVIRLLIEDVNVRVDYLATFNGRDFIDVCATRNVDII